MSIQVLDEVTVAEFSDPSVCRVASQPGRYFLPRHVWFWVECGDIDKAAADAVAHFSGESAGGERSEFPAALVSDGQIGFLPMLISD